MKGPSLIDKVILWNRERPLSSDELKGFGPVKKPTRTTRPYIRIFGPDKEDGPKCRGWFIGVKGVF